MKKEPISVAIKFVWVNTKGLPEPFHFLSVNFLFFFLGDSQNQQVLERTEQPQVFFPMFPQNDRFAKWDNSLLHIFQPVFWKCFWVISSKKMRKSIKTTRETQLCTQKFVQVFVLWTCWDEGPLLPYCRRCHQLLRSRLNFFPKPQGFKPPRFLLPISFCVFVSLCAKASLMHSAKPRRLIGSACN